MNERNATTIQKLLDSKLSIKEIAEKIQQSPEHVRSVIKEHNLKFRGIHYSRLKELSHYLPEIQKMYDENVSKRHIASKLKIGNHTLNFFIDFYNLTSSSRDMFPGIKKLEGKQNEVQELLDKKTSKSEIARRLGVSFAIVSSFIKRNSLKEQITSSRAILQKNKKQIEQMFASGVPKTSIAKHFNVGFNSVFSFIEKHRFPSVGFILLPWCCVV